MTPRTPLSTILSLPATLRPILARGINTTPITRSTTSHTTPSSTSTSIDPTEISHFNSLASSWWDPHGPSRLLHLMNPLRHTFITSCLASQPTPLDPNRKLNYLDVGCGGGIFAESAARLKHTASVTAVDPSAEVLAVAKEHARRDPGLRGRLRYLGVGIEELASARAARSDQISTAGTQGQSQGQEAKHEGYDIATLFEVIEHVSSPSAFLAQVAQHVKPGGWLVLSTIARTWTSWATTKVMAEDVLRIVPRGTHEWEKYVNEGEVRSWFESQGGWTSPRAMGVLYVPGVGWREVKGGEEWGNYFLAARKME